MGEIGETLRERRIALKIDVNEVENATKIRAKYLRALENEEFDLLPGPAYARSFLRSYGDYLGLDTVALLNTYRRQAGTPDDDPIAYMPSVEQSGRKRRRWLIVVAALIALALLIFIVGLLSGSGGS